MHKYNGKGLVGFNLGKLGWLALCFNFVNGRCSEMVGPSLAVLTVLVGASAFQGQ